MGIRFKGNIKHPQGRLRGKPLNPPVDFSKDFAFSARIQLPSAALANSFAISDNSKVMLSTRSNSRLVDHYRLEAGVWTYKNSFQTTNTTNLSSSSADVAISGDGSIAVVGTRAVANDAYLGVIDIYYYNASTKVYDFFQRISANTAHGSIFPYTFGRRVAISANGLTIAVASSARNSSTDIYGYTAVYTKDGEVWTYRTRVDGQRFEDMGNGIAISKDGKSVATTSVGFNYSTFGVQTNMRVMYTIDYSTWNQRRYNVANEYVSQTDYALTDMVVTTYDDANNAIVYHKGPIISGSYKGKLLVYLADGSVPDNSTNAAHIELTPSYAIGGKPFTHWAGTSGNGVTLIQSSAAGQDTTYGTIQVWNNLTGGVHQEQQKIVVPVTDQLSGLPMKFSADGRYLMWRNAAGTITVYSR